VIKYVDDSNALLSQLNYLLASGGYILIGTPNAANIDLARPDIYHHYNPIHTLYYLHLYTAKPLEYLGCCQEQETVRIFDRLDYALPFALHTPAWNEYQRLLDGALNVVLKSIKTWKALTCYKYLFYALFCY